MMIGERQASRTVLMALVACSIPSTIPAQAADSEPDAAPAARNAIYFELGGNAILYSVNYERRLGDGFAVPRRMAC